ncbi:MAG: hypothetical protein RL181_504 [Bacteroidota bacterium]
MRGIFEGYCTRQYGTKIAETMGHIEFPLDLVPLMPVSIIYRFFHF